MRRMRVAARFAAALLAAALLVALVAGCGQSAAQKAAADRDECYANESQILSAINLEHADSGEYADVNLVAKTLNLKCPSGGTYTFDPNTDIVSCTVHGHAAKQQEILP